MEIDKKLFPDVVLGELLESKPLSDRIALDIYTLACALRQQRKDPNTKCVKGQGANTFVGLFWFGGRSDIISCQNCPVNK